MKLKELLDEKFALYDRQEFIHSDPIKIPHLFSKKQDIEIAGFFAATLAWGQRTTIIRKCRELLALMDNAPYDFILHHQENDLKPFLEFKHRTFNDIDALYFISFLQHYYSRSDSLEDAFYQGMKPAALSTKDGIISFHELFFSLPHYPERTRKHVATPARMSACKRINMFLRWMVRKDKQGVDFGIWKKIQPGQLVCPCDLHVERVARRLGLITRKQMDWKTAEELTKNLKTLDAEDPVKYDFALFGLGIEERFEQT